jgi:hypothetical protein
MKMKKLTIIGLILTIMAVGVFLACAGVSTEAHSQSKHPKHLKIWINTETGELIDIKDQDNKPAKKLTPAQLQQIYQNQTPLEIGKILYTQSSPGCVTVVILGWPFQICS